MSENKEPKTNDLKKHAIKAAHRSADAIEKLNNALLSIGDYLFDRATFYPRLASAALVFSLYAIGFEIYMYYEFENYGSMLLRKLAPLGFLALAYGVSRFRHQLPSEKETGE